MNKELSKWSLFLDRDGVINRRIMNGYVTRWEEFEFLPGVLKAMKILGENFLKIIVVTNQQGVGKGLMSEDDLEKIHDKMISEVEAHGGRIDEVIYCPDLATTEPNCRKPNSTMAHIARSLHPEIVFNKSVMAGDTESDLIFGKSLNMKIIFIENTDQYKNFKTSPNASYTDLLGLSSDIKNIIG